MDQKQNLISSGAWTNPSWPHTFTNVRIGKIITAPYVEAQNNVGIAFSSDQGGAFLLLDNSQGQLENNYMALLLAAAGTFPITISADANYYITAVTVGNS